MVKICDSNKYPSENEERYKEYFDKAPYSLHIFQKWTTEAIIEGHHVLVCCPTGSGKTYGGEFAIDFFTENTSSTRKKVIYTTPIKSLSNQKFYNFTKKYPNKSVGLITGDIKCNPDADIIIMTTEILLNKLYQINQSDASINNTNALASFDMNIVEELACVVFDEVHYIGDKERGHVWENSIIMLPKHVQMVMLSATLASPKIFAEWIESQNSNKTVYLTLKEHRAVPLIHYSFISVISGIFKTIKDKSVHEEIRSVINKPIIIQKSSGEFVMNNFHLVRKNLDLFDKHQIYSSTQHVLNNVSTYLVQNEMLPALCYVFSRKKLQKWAKEITVPLLEFDSKIAYTIARDCEQIIRKFPNYKEYLELPEYIELVALLEKGIGIHHAGMLPIFKEMVEILFSKGCIKLLFATETMCVGINMPVKTVIFTDIYKYDGNNNRLLCAHEYTQSAGRAGRLGLDTVGHVIHLNNLFRPTTSIDYKLMMNGEPLRILSNFKFSYNLILNLVSIGETNYSIYAERGLLQKELCAEINQYNIELQLLAEDVNKMERTMAAYKTPIESAERFVELKIAREISINKARKKIDKELSALLNSNADIEKVADIVIKRDAKQVEIAKLKSNICNANSLINANIDKIVNILRNYSIIEDGTNAKDVTNNCIVLTKKGQLASYFKEVHCLVFSELLLSKQLQTLETCEIVGLLSCFTNISIPSEKRLKKVGSVPKYVNVEQLIELVSNMYEEQYNLEVNVGISTGIDYDLHYELVNYVIAWCNCETDVDCKGVLSELASANSPIFVGEFVKAILKINNIVSELINAATWDNDLEFVAKLNSIPQLTLKFVAENQSLYI